MTVKERYEALDTAIGYQLRRSNEIRYYYGAEPERQELEEVVKTTRNYLKLMMPQLEELERLNAKYED